MENMKKSTTYKPHPHLITDHDSPLHEVSTNDIKPNRMLLPSVAILYQAHMPPVIGGLRKPMKVGGYTDSGADIAFVLRQQGISVVTPVDKPDASINLDWVFPDTTTGITEACARGAEVLWLNTVLFNDHPIDPFIREGGRVVGQPVELSEQFDDKWATKMLLHAHGLPTPQAAILTQCNIERFTQYEFTFPVVFKPIRGRGSVGVRLIHTIDNLMSHVNDMLQSKEFGDAIMVEQYLPGEEVTVTVMPSGTYMICGEKCTFELPWCLPPVKRFDQQNGIAPSTMVVAACANSKVMDEMERIRPAVVQLKKDCIAVAQLIDIRAPIRIDCRQSSSEGLFHILDLNMKPNMTGVGRPGREDMNGLVAIAAQAIGWSYADLLQNVLCQMWSLH